MNGRIANFVRSPVTLEVAFRVLGPVYRTVPYFICGDRWIENFASEVAKLMGGRGVDRVFGAIYDSRGFVGRVKTMGRGS